MMVISKVCEVQLFINFTDDDASFFNFWNTIQIQGFWKIMYWTRSFEETHHNVFLEWHEILMELNNDSSLIF